MTQDTTPTTDDDAWEHLRLELMIVHPKLSPAEITATLGLEPQWSRGVGEPRRTPKGKSLPGEYAETRWRYRVDHVVEAKPFFTGELAALLDLLAPHKQFLQGLRSGGGRACVTIEFLVGDLFHDAIRPSLLARLVELELDLGIEASGVFGGGVPHAAIDPSK
jgi:hypothetical protein